MIDPKDMAHCVEAIRHGSRSFHTASKLLPASVRDPALALYAFCRLADDAVDLQSAKADAVLNLHERLDRAYRGRPCDAPADRAFTSVIEEFNMPRALPEALLEGLAWDAMERRYQTLSELHDYSARVASAVGAMMCVLMRVRDPNALARACDLGVAMQLTNIARDVGEDAREGRFYLPIDWMDEAGLDVDDFLRRPQMSAEIGSIIARLLRQAELLYDKSEAGLHGLPFKSRPGIFAARFVYAGIGKAVRKNGLDSVNARAYTTTVQKIGWLMLSMMRAGATIVMPTNPVIYASALPETQFLVDAAADRSTPAKDWSDTLYRTMASLKAQDRTQKDAVL